MLEKIYSLANELFAIPEVNAAILFGSVARGEPMGRKSDVDVLVLVRRENEALERKVFDITEKYERVVPSISTFEELAKNPYFAYEILRDGTVLFKKPSPFLRLPFAMPERAMTIYTVNAKHLSHETRMKLNRALYGERVRAKLKGGEAKSYEYRGLVCELGGRILGRGAFLVPSSAEDRINDVLGKYKAVGSKTHVVLVGEE